jgi:hypothetical protein
MKMVDEAVMAFQDSATIIFNIQLEMWLEKACRKPVYGDHFFSHTRVEKYRTVLLS